MARLSSLVVQLSFVSLLRVVTPADIATRKARAFSLPSPEGLRCGHISSCFADWSHSLRGGESQQECLRHLQKAVEERVNGSARVPKQVQS